MTRARVEIFVLMCACSPHSEYIIADSHPRPGGKTGIFCIPVGHASSTAPVPKTHRKQTNEFLIPDLNSESIRSLITGG